MIIKTIKENILQWARKAMDQSNDNPNLKGEGCVRRVNIVPSTRLTILQKIIDSVMCAYSFLRKCPHLNVNSQV